MISLAIGNTTAFTTLIVTDTYCAISFNLLPTMTHDHSDKIFVSPPRQDHYDKVKKFVIYYVFAYIFLKFDAKAIQNRLNCV